MNTPEPCKSNSALLRTILHEPMASRWNGHTYRPYRLHNVKKHSPEYKRVKNLFKITGHDFFIRKILRVENPFLLGQYLLRKENMVRKNRYIRERLLFHGTKPANIDGICAKNFDWRRNGEARGHKYGHGVCFSPDVSFASQFGYRVMILARVLVSKTIVGNSDTVVPPGDFETTRNRTGTVLVKYEDAEYYPEYVIYYSKRFQLHKKIRRFF